MEVRMSIPHPIPYQGSKRKLAWAIIACLPHNTERLFEPFAGSAAMSIAAAYRNRAKHFVLNDINAPLIELWKSIISEPRSIAAQYRIHWEAQHGKEKEYYLSVREQFNRTYSPDCFLYLLARCVKAAVRYNAYGEFNQSSDNRRKGSHPDTMERHIIRTSKLFSGRVTLSSQDYRASLKDVSPQDVVYMDPPYQGVCANRDPRYIEGLSFDHFVEALHSLNDRGISYIVSYDGRTGTKAFGKRLPVSLDLVHVEVDAGRSTQATLLGRDSKTYESLYLSSALLPRIGEVPQILRETSTQQARLFS
jgi:DNA adenine methylase